MKVTLSVNKPLNGHTFQAADKVQGRVDVHLDDISETPEVRVIFQGIAKVTLKPGFDAKAQIGDTHKRQSYKLFTYVQTLHPTEVDGKTLSAPFAFSFPQTVRCCGRANTLKSAVCPLPPSTLLSTPGVKVRVSYGVTAVCRRPGSGLYHRLLHRTVTTRQSITYAPPIAEQLLYGTPPLTPPASPPTSPVNILADPMIEANTNAQAHSHAHAHTQSALQLIRSTAWLPASKLGIEDYGIDTGAPTSKTQQQALLPGCLPPYSPSMTLEAVMPPVITPGQPVDLGLFLRTPRSVLNTVAETGGGLQLCSLSVRLRRQTQARIGASTRIDETTWPIWSVQGSMPIRQEKVDIACGNNSNNVHSESCSRRNSDISEDTTVESERSEDSSNFGKMAGMNLPAACTAAIEGQPGFGTCFASRRYTLEVTMGVAVVSSTLTSKKPVVPASDIQYTKTAIRVMVSEPPPDYERNMSV
ncbi:hypothetical protein Sste5346_004700 [Sporothrix stenoceras]|uniref:Arrestin-like N-terminal domain-containing protein n=1 Tax=Sporothrix stenoceras TaxID=5173 RepID=A0ABR3Z6P3_9PEZI